MHKSEPRANPTLITHVNKAYELRTETTKTYKNIVSLTIQF